MKSFVAILILCWTSCPIAQPNPTVSPPECSGDVNYIWLETGGPAPFDGYLITDDGVECLVKKDKWWAGMLLLRERDLKEGCDNEKKFIKDALIADLNQCNKGKTSCFNKLGRANAWYNNKWLWFSVGFVGGAVITGATVYLVTK